MYKNVRVVFDRRKQATKTKVAVIEIVVCIQRERCYFSTGYFINKAQWEDGKVVNHPRAVVLNEEIEKKVTQFNHILIAMEVNKDYMSIEQFKTYIGPESDGSRQNFMAWLRERIEKRSLREGTRRAHYSMYHSLERFGRFKTFRDVTLQNIHHYDLFIREEKTFTSKGKPIVRSQAAIHNYHKRLRTYVTEAFQLGLIEMNPYERFKVKRGDKNERPHLNEEQLKKLIKMREESTDLVMNKYMDFFLFQIFTGMAYSDAKNFDYERDVVKENGMTFIEGKRMKTGKKFATPLLPITQKILERNNYHMHIPSNQKYNQFLKGIGLAIGCTFPLTTHIARHTFACTVVLGKGIPKEVLQIMMGHSSIKTTEIYAKMPMQFVSQNIDQKIFRVWK